MSKYIELTQENFKDTINNGVTLVDFWAPWCSPCRMLGPVIEELAEEFEGKANICKLDVDEANHQEITSEYGIRTIPTVILFKDGKIQKTINGANEKSIYTDELNKLL